MFDKGEAAFKGTLVWSDLQNIAITEGGGTVSATGATVNYLEGLPPVVGANAKGDFDLSQMSVVVSGGGIGPLKLKPSTIKLTDFEKDVQNIDIPIRLIGPVQSVLKLIDAPRFKYAQAVGLKPEDVTGNIDGGVDLKFPLLKSILMKDAAITADGQLTDLASGNLVKGINISEGDMTLALDKAGFSLNGKAAIQKIPFLISWEQAFDEKSGKPLKHATLNGDVSGEQWGRLGVDALATTQGPIAVKLEVLQKTKKSTSFTGSLDMKNALMDVSDLKWKKPLNTPATASFAAEMPEGKDINITSIEAEGPGLKIKGKGTLSAADMKPVSITLNPLIVGRTDVALRYTQVPGANGKLTFNAEGAALDISGMHGSNDTEHADPRSKEFHLKVAKFYTSDTGYISKVSAIAVRDPQGWSQINLHGLADGGPMLSMDLDQLTDGHRNLLITCDDFGEALKGLGFTDTVKGGKLKISGVSTVEKPRLINGKIYITHFDVKDLPVLVVLMNATSPFGIFNLVSGKLGFDQLQGKFRWQGDALDLDNIRASGDSVGMTISGKADMNSGKADLNGTVAPFSMINRIIGSIPLIGDMITGGEGQGVLGVTYTIKGSLDKPDVSVNPASLLTPGILRSIFFGGSDSDDSSDDTPPAKPVTPSSAAPVPASKSAPATNFNK